MITQTYKNVHIALCMRTKKWEGPKRPPAGSRHTHWGPCARGAKHQCLLQLGWALTSLLRERQGATDRFLIRLTAAVERLPR